MANPCNSSVLTGRITQDPSFIATKTGIEFASQIVLAVPRNYLNKGEKLSDFILVRYEGESRMGFAHKLKKGEVVSVSGAIKTDVFMDNTGTKHYQTYLLADNISYPPYTAPASL